MGKGVADYLDTVLFTYTLAHLLSKDKVRFYYALKGRDGKSGIIQRYSIDRLAKGVLLVPKEYWEDVEEFLQFWHCKYKKRKVLVEK